MNTSVHTRKRAASLAWVIAGALVACLFVLPTQARAATTYTITSGTSFNSAVKTLVKGSYAAYGAYDSLVKSITFLPNGRTPQGVTLSSLSSKTLVTGIDLYWRPASGAIYVASSGNIAFPSNSRYMMSDFTVLEAVDARFVDTSKATDMGNIFSGDKKLSSPSSIQISTWDTSNATSMTYMFANCTELTSLDMLATWDTSKVMNFGRMFSNCSSLQSVGAVSSWNTSSATSLTYMFNDCTSLTSVDVANWNTANVQQMAHVFNNCRLLEIDLSGWDTAKVLNFQGMVGDNFPGIRRVVLGPNFVTKGAGITDVNMMFRMPNASLVSPYTGKWINESVEGSKPVKATEFADYYNGSIHAGSYVWATEMPFRVTIPTRISMSDMPVGTHVSACVQVDISVTGVDEPVRVTGGSCVMDSESGISSPIDVRAHSEDEPLLFTDNGTQIDVIDFAGEGVFLSDRWTGTVPYVCSLA